MPTPLPEQLHDHGPWPLTALGVPDAQRSVAGASVTCVLALPPQAPSTFSCTLAAQLTVAPPLTPAHVHDHGPLPSTDEGAPVWHNFATGAEPTAAPLAAPQEPSLILAVSQAVFCLPLMQIQFHGPEPRTALALPVAHKALVGAVAIGWLAASPQTGTVFSAVFVGLAAKAGATGCGATAAGLVGTGGGEVSADALSLPSDRVRQDDLWPALSAHDHVQGPEPLMALAMPERHKSRSGAS